LTVRAAARRTRAGAHLPAAGMNGAGPAGSHLASPERGATPRGPAGLDPVLDLMRRAFERALARSLPPSPTPPPRLHAAMRYAALSPGKRLRPMLCLAACRATGGRWRDALPAAVALECVHAFSLVHDDLPAMDDDDYRRGRLTTHRKFGEALGVLAGDALLAQAFETLARARDLTPARRVEAVRVLAGAAGSRWLVGGQAMDLDAEGRRVTLDDVRAIHLRKTARLIQAALVLGGLSGGATAARLRALDALGRDVGLAFQIQDDLMNRGSSLRTLGKRAGTDEARGKATWPRAVGEARARREADRLHRRALARVERFGPPGNALASLIRASAERRR
jgi:geranylgeranyl diphosphate synthase type II